VLGSTIGEPFPLNIPRSRYWHRVIFLISSRCFSPRNWKIIFTAHMIMHVELSSAAHLGINGLIVSDFAVLPSNTFQVISTIAL